MIIRPANKSDTEYLIKTIDSVFSYHSEIDSFYMISPREVTEEFLLKQDLTFIACEEYSGPIGAVVGSFTEYPRDRQYPYATLKNIWVEESKRKGGVASELLKKFELEAKKKGAKLVDIHVDVRNTLATDFWNTSGYELYQERRKKKLT